MFIDCKNVIACDRETSCDERRSKKCMHIRSGGILMDFECISSAENKRPTSDIVDVNRKQEKVGEY